MPRPGRPDPPRIHVHHLLRTGSGADPGPGIGADGVLREVCAGMEEEGIPFEVVEVFDVNAGPAPDLAHAAALRSPLEVGVGIDADGAVAVHHAKRPAGRAVSTVVADAGTARAAGHDAARIVIGTPLTDPPTRSSTPPPARPSTPPPARPSTPPPARPPARPSVPAVSLDEEK